MIEEGSIAAEEWQRICEDLDSRRILSPAWGCMILVAASAFEGVKRLGAIMAQHGRTDAMNVLHADNLGLYREACRNLMVTPHPSVTVRPVKKGA